MRKQSVCKQSDNFKDLPAKLKENSKKTAINILTAVEVNQLNQGKCEKFMDFMIIEPCLGSGAQGSVSLVRDVNSRIYYARKTVTAPDSIRLVNQVCRVNSQLITQKEKYEYKGNYVIQIFQNYVTVMRIKYYLQVQENSVFLILEYAEMGSLYQLIKRRQRIMEKEAYQYFLQTIKGLEYMHSMKVVHRDIKPENLLLTKSGDIKICDFGWATEMPNYSKAFCGTVEYMAPEMIQQQITDYKSDIWSLGVLLYEMVQGQTPFSGNNYIEKSQKILSRKQLEYQYAVTDECKSLIKLLLNLNMYSRPSFEQIKGHQWILMQGQDRRNQGSIRSSSMAPIKSPHYTSEIVEVQQKIQSNAEKSSVKEWEAMKFRSQQFQFQRQQEQTQNYSDKGFLIKALTVLGCINR